MAKLEIPIIQSTRSCKVDGRPGYFHTWEQYSQPVPPSLMIGGHPGGVVAQVFGIVEFSDCVQRVEPHKIKFDDDMNERLAHFEKWMKGEEANEN